MLMDNRAIVNEEEPVVTEFHDPRSSMDFWYPKLLDVEDLNIPATGFMRLEEQPESGMPMVDTEKAMDLIRHNGWDKVFVRSVFKSAQMSLREGSWIINPNEEKIRATVAELLAQHSMMKFPHGGLIAFREFIDLNYCSYESRAHTHESEIRYFIRGGEVDHLCSKPEQIAKDVEECDSTFSSIENTVSKGLTPPFGQAKRVSRRFGKASVPSPMSVDFALDTNGKWWLIDMGLDGIYWNENQNEWMDISGHSHGCVETPTVRYADKLKELEEKEERKEKLDHYYSKLEMLIDNNDADDGILRATEDGVELAIEYNEPQLSK